MLERALESLRTTLLLLIVPLRPEWAAGLASIAELAKSDDPGFAGSAIASKYTHEVLLPKCNYTGMEVEDTTELG